MNRALLVRRQPAWLRVAGVSTLVVSAVALLAVIDLGLFAAVELVSPHGAAVPAVPDVRHVPRPATVVPRPADAGAAAPRPTPATPVTDSVANTVLPEREDGVAIDLAFDPRLGSRALQAFLAQDGSCVCLLQLEGGEVRRFVQPGPDGLPAVDMPARMWGAFKQQHPTPDWLWIPCSRDALPAEVTDQWPDLTPVVLLAPRATRRVFAERQQLLAHAARSGAARRAETRTLVELSCRTGSTPQLTIRLQGE